MSPPFSSALRFFPLLAVISLLVTHVLGGGHRNPARLCYFEGSVLLLLPFGSSPARNATLTKVDPASCRVAPPELLLLDELPPRLLAPLLRAVGRFAYVGASVAPAGIQSAARISPAPPASGWPAPGEWTNVRISPPGNFSIPASDDLFATPGAATIEGKSLRVQWLNASGEAAAILCDFPALERCELAPAIATPNLLQEVARNFSRACDETWRASPRAGAALAGCAIEHWNRTLAACPAFLSDEESRRLGAELASVPFYRWPKPEIRRMRECPALAQNETVKAFLEMRPGKTLD